MNIDLDGLAKFEMVYRAVLAEDEPAARAAFKVLVDLHHRECGWTGAEAVDTVLFELLTVADYMGATHLLRVIAMHCIPPDAVRCFLAAKAADPALFNRAMRGMRRAIDHLRQQETITE
jgi:hypothetical protein